MICSTLFSSQTRAVVCAAVFTLALHMIAGQAFCENEAAPDVFVTASYDKASDNIKISLLAPAEKKLETGIWFFNTEGELQAVAKTEIEKGKTSALFPLPKEKRWESTDSGTISVFVYNSSAAECRLQITRPKKSVDSAKAPKPMGHGVYSEKNGVQHHWYIDDDYALVWDGKPYIPYGGMYCSDLLSFYTTDKNVQKKKLATDRKVLDLVTQNGFHDLYVNLGHGTVKDRQIIVEEFNKRNIKFGWQLGAGSPVNVFEIRKSARSGLVTGTVKEPGKLELQMPRYNLKGLLLLNKKGGVARFVEMKADLSKKDNSFQFILLDLKEDKAAKTVGMTVDIKDLDKGEYYVLPLTVHKGHFSNVWDSLDKMAEHLSWIKEMNWGPNFRFFVEVMHNEGGMYNQSEPVRVYEPGFNRAFAGWLEKRYGSLERLAKEWSFGRRRPDSFEMAARLIPLRDVDSKKFKETVLWIDPESGDVFVTSDGPGQGWLDYVEGSRILYAQGRGHVAAKIKEMVNVPVVIKRVAPWTTETMVSDSASSFDGIGLELYPAWGSAITTGLACGRVEADHSKRTMWMIGTEMGFNAAPNNGGKVGWPSEEYLENFVRTTAAFGAKGFMFFGLRLEPYGMWKNMQIPTLPDQMKWLTDIRQRLLADWPRTVSYGLSYPQGENWWWRSNGELINRYRAVYDTPISSVRQSLVLNGKETPEAFCAISTSLAVEDADPIIVNFASRESVDRYGPQVLKWKKEGKHIIYLGHWPEGARLKGFSNHFTGKKIRTEGNNAIQQLQVGRKDTVLAQEDDAVWAKISGKTMFITKSGFNVKENTAFPPNTLKEEWLKALSKK